VVRPPQPGQQPTSTFCQPNQTPPRTRKDRGEERENRRNRQNGLLVSGKSNRPLCWTILAHCPVAPHTQHHTPPPAPPTRPTFPRPGHPAPESACLLAPPAPGAFCFAPFICLCAFCIRRHKPTHDKKKSKTNRRQERRTGERSCAQKGRGEGERELGWLGV
jgi:hypothetical protein